MHAKTYLLQRSTVVIIFSLFFCFESLTAQVVSTSTGGNWSSGSTWIGGIAPGPTSNVVIDGNVKVDISISCNNLTVNGSGTLSPPTFGNRTLTVNGSLTNYGIITDDFYRLYLNIAGDVINNGTWANYRTTLNGADQNLSATSPFTGNSLIRNNGPGKVIVWSDLELIGCIIKFNNDTLYMTDGYSITETDKRLENIVIEKDPAGSYPVTLNLSNAWYQFLTCIADTTILLGDHQAGSSVVFKSNVVNNGSFKNYSSGSSTVTFEKSLINNGSVTDNYYNTSLLLYGDLINNGSLSNKYIYLRGTADQHIWSYNPITVNNITNQELSGLVVAETDLSFSGTNVNLNNDTLKFTGGDSLHLEAGAKLINTVLLSVPAKAAGTFSIDMAGNSYVQNIVASADGFNLSGDFQINPGNSVLNGPVNILGTFRPTGTGSVTATLYGDVVNEGTITNNYYSLTLNIAGNVVHNGVWDNNYTTLTGSGIRNINQTKPFGSNTFEVSGGINQVNFLSVCWFENTNCEMGGTTVVMPVKSSVILSAGKFRNAVLQANESELLMSSACYFENVSISNLDMHGFVLIGTGCSLDGLCRVFGS
ncbi:MAG: hypothetical protein Kow00127_23520 [Bacteroidales bacterium]